MLMLKSVHHINLLVRDLDAAVARYRDAFAVEHFSFGELPERGVRTARFRAGETWVVLVQPLREDSVPGRHLAAHGEGLFLLSFGVDSLQEARASVERAGARCADVEPRTGLDGWQVMDLEAGDFAGAQLQFTSLAPVRHGE
jgi:methylmalonyl-CoA/ethylmalonyl-CoA epimerase